jgi:tRNA threonylcarbamoyladenosine biosynthesis protein TsaE
VKTIISNSADETIQIAERIAPILKTRDVIILVGDLGSGKTKFVEGILKYFGLEDEISSPTFTIVNEYNAKNQNIYHFDVYRLEDTDEFYAIGGEEYFDKGICLIEWGEQIKDALPINYKKITFSRDLEHENMRVLNFEGFDEIKI